MERVTMQLENDRRLLKFNTYEEYLDSMVTCTDLVNFRSSLEARNIAGLGYRSSGDTLIRAQFNKRWTACKNFFFPTSVKNAVISDTCPDIESKVIRALAKREEDNRRGKLATILFLRIRTELGFEISAYIDYADRISRENWLPIFQEKKKIKPRVDDLSYFHWKQDKIRQNNSLNFKAIIDPNKGLFFQCWHDRKVVNVDPKAYLPWHTTRRIFPTTDYEQVVIYDHLIRRYC